MNKQEALKEIERLKEFIEEIDKPKKPVFSIKPDEYYTFSKWDEDSFMCIMHNDLSDRGDGFYYAGWFDTSYFDVKLVENGSFTDILVKKK